MPALAQRSTSRPPAALALVVWALWIAGWSSAGCAVDNPLYDVRADAAGAGDGPLVAADRLSDSSPSVDSYDGGPAPPVDGAMPVDSAPSPPDLALPVADLESHLIGYWRLDEGVGTMTADSSGRGHHGTLEGFETPPPWTAGKVGGGLALSNDTPLDRGVRVNASAAINGLRRFTLAAWVRRSPTNVDYHSVISRQIDGSDYEIFNLCFVNNLLTLYLPRVGGAGTYSARATVPTPIGEWVHVAGTYDGSTGRVFRAGQLEGSVAFTTPFPASTSPVYLGTNKNSVTSNQPLGGVLDEVILYDEALPAAAIAALAAGHRPRLP